MSTHPFETFKLRVQGAICKTYQLTVTFFLSQLINQAQEAFASASHSYRKLFLTLEALPGSDR